MRKSLLKSVVAVAVVGATMAMTNVIAMAAMATGTYNIADYDVTKIELDKNGRIPGSTELFDGLKCVKGLNYIDAKEAGVALAASSPEDSTVKLDNVALPSGSTTAGNTWVLSLDKDAEVGVYYTISNSDGLKKSSSAKGTLSVPNATEIVKDSGANKEVLEVYYVSFKAPSAGDYELVTDSNRLMLYSVVVKNAESGSETPVAETFVKGTVDETPAVALVDGKYYAFAAISEEKAERAVTLTVGGENTDTVYSKVSLTGLDKSAAADFADGAAYVCGFEVNFTNAPTSVDLATLQSKISIN